jgi:hypothetical protein
MIVGFVDIGRIDDKESLNSDHHQFYQYQQNQQSSLT